MILLVVFIVITAVILIFLLYKLISALKEVSNLPRQNQRDDSESNWSPPKESKEKEKEVTRKTVTEVQSLKSRPELSSKQSMKSLVSVHNSEDSLRSKKSTGFIPTLKSVFPVSSSNNRGSQNFLMLLDSLDAIDDDEIEKKAPPSTIASCTGIEANPSDETASQTLIGRELNSSEDPGRILLNLIKSDDPD